MKKYILHMVVAVAGLAAVAAPQADAKVVVHVDAPAVVAHPPCVVVPPPPPPPRHRLVKPRCPHCRVVYDRGVPHLVCVHCCPAAHHHHHHHAKPKKHKPAPPPPHHHHGHAPKRHRR